MPIEIERCWLVSVLPPLADEGGLHRHIGTGEEPAKAKRMRTLLRGRKVGRA
jgi:hypothetical protein